MDSSRYLSLLVGVSAAFLAGCASNLESVGRFGASGVALTKAYRPLVDDIDVQCQSRLVTGSIMRQGEYKYAQRRQEAADICKPLQTKKAIVLEFATLVEGYSNALVTLSGVRPDVLSADFDSMNVAAKALKVTINDPEKPGETKEVPLIEAAQVDAITKILKVAGEIYVARKTHSEARSALQQGREPLTVLVSAMVTYAEAMYGQELNDASADAQVRLENLIQLSNAPLDLASAERSRMAIRESIPYRSLQQQYQSILDGTAARQQEVVRLRAAGEALVKANDDLAANFDKLTEPGRLEVLKDLIRKVRALHDGITHL
jgi:hypothetical protein